ncbi:MAG: choice-of-anchor Q domain-containing protein [Flavisolibacter sp.]
MKPVKNLFFFFILLAFYACKKDAITNSASVFLRVSEDTLHFDTVFTTTGSVSQLVKIINDHDKGISISSVKIAGGQSSPFKINVDGSPGPEVKNVEILAHDSMYVFVTVRIDPNSSSLPFLVHDSIEINYNGNIRFIQLDAFGKNAHFFRNKKITGSETWNNDLPYVILGGLVVDSNAVLTINRGCHVFVHADAPFIINGSLQVNGAAADSGRVVFSGDRTDDPYRDFPASYPGLIFTSSSKNNLISFAIIKNAYQAVVAAGPGVQLTLNETIIDNAWDAGILGINASITARNVLVSNCGKNIFLVQGGNYQFTHCTAATYSSSYIQHKDPILVVTDFVNLNGSPAVSNLNALFRNCIFWGENNGIVPDEAVVLRQGTGNSFQVVFENVLWRVEHAPANCTIKNPINQDPLFELINTTDRIYRFQLSPQSPAIDKGVDASVTLDLDGHPRPVGLPDLGAYEKQ